MRWVIYIATAAAALVALVAVTGLMLPKEHVASRTVRFKTPPQAIWDVVTGPPDWRPDVRSFETLPARAGRPAWKEVDKHGQAITFETIESQAPSRLVTRIADHNLPFGGTWTYEIAPDPQGSALTITENGEIYNPIFRFVSRFVMGHTATIEAYIKALRDRLGKADSQTVRPTVH
jgi:uncharacterized protein YndB with AHSA1/START domain